MAATDSPKKQEGKPPKKRRYFRRRRRKNAQDPSRAVERNVEGGDVRKAPRAGSKSQNRRRSENRRSSSRRRRGGAARASQKPAAVVEEESQPQSEVYIYTHVVRPRNRDGLDGEFHAEHSLNLSGTTASALIGMDHLLESIGQQLDVWFQPELAPSPTEAGSGGDDDVSKTGFVEN